jgi:quinol monooxygenase YgiN
VSRYIVTLPVQDDTKTDIYMIEEYASQEASDAHIQTAPVQNLINLFTTGDLLAAPPEVHNNSIISQKLLSSSLSVSANPAIVLANFGYKPGTLENALNGWKEVINYVTKNEEPTRAYAILATDGGNEVRTVEVYDNWDYVSNVHLKGPEIAQNQEQNGKDRTGQGAVRVRAVDGYLGKGLGGSKI